MSPSESPLRGDFQRVNQEVREKEKELEVRASLLSLGSLSTRSK